MDQVVPLGNRCVLEFIDENVAVAVPDSFINEGCRIVANNRRNLPIQRRQQPNVFVPLNGRQLVPNQPQRADQAHALLQVFLEFKGLSGFTSVKLAPSFHRLGNNWDNRLDLAYGGF